MQCLYQISPPFTISETIFDIKWCTIKNIIIFWRIHSYSLTCSCLSSFGTNMQILVVCRLNRRSSSPNLICSFCLVCFFYSTVAVYFNFKVLGFSFSSSHAFRLAIIPLCLLKHCIFLTPHRHRVSQIQSQKKNHPVICPCLLLQYFQQWVVKLCCSPLTITWKIWIRRMSLDTAGVSYLQCDVFSSFSLICLSRICGQN